MPPKPIPDLYALASEALDLWQDYLASLAADPKARAGLMQLMEPTRRLFAEWMEKAQTGAYATAPFTTAQAGTRESAEPKTENRAPAARAASDDGSLRLAQLAHELAEFEERLARLESGTSAPAKTAKASRRRPRHGV